MKRSSLLFKQKPYTIRSIRKLHATKNSYAKNPKDTETETEKKKNIKWKTK